MIEGFVERQRHRSPAAWAGLAIGLIAFVYVRTQGAPIVPSSVVFAAHVWIVLEADDRLSGSGGESA